MRILLLTKFEAKLEVHKAIFHGDVQFGLARFAGPHLHDFPHTVKEEGFLSLCEGDWRGGLHGEFFEKGRSLNGNHGSYLKLRVHLF